MTARELCNYLVTVASGDYEIRFGAESLGATIGFTKFIQNTQLYDPNSQVLYNACNRTCKNFLYYVAKHNLEDYYVVSPVRTWRVVNYMDISVDPVRREVVFR